MIERRPRGLSVAGCRGKCGRGQRHDEQLK
jgi:hypothetical protein